VKLGAGGTQEAEMLVGDFEDDGASVELGLRLEPQDRS
jgi:hypothetical protein